MKSKQPYPNIYELPADMMPTTNKLWQFISTLAMITILGLILGGCRLPSDGIPAANPLFPTPNPTQVVIFPVMTTTAKSMRFALPLVVQSGSGVGPANLVTSTGVPAEPSTPLPSATAAATATQVDTATPQPSAQITLLFTGVIVPARCVQSAIDARGDASYVYDEVRQTIQSADLAVGTLNTTFSDLSTHTGCIETYVLVSDARSAVAAAQAGFDVMSVATNHIKNCAGESCGDDYNRAFIDTLDNLRKNNILPVGAGMNMAEALQPVVVTVKGVRFGFVSLGMVEPNAFAGEAWPGIAELTGDNLTSAIAAARQVADVVIAMPHWGPEDIANPNSYQLHFAQVAVEAGADVVVGNHTHVVQAIQNINGIDVFYGLGNFVFDQNWDLAHQQGVMLQLHFTGTKYTGYDLIPTHVDFDGTVHIAGTDEAAAILQRIQEASDRLK